MNASNVAETEKCLRELAKQASINRDQNWQTLLAAADICKQMGETPSGQAREAGDDCPAQPCVLPFELALIRWSVVCTSWGELATGYAPLLTAFLAGWGCRCIEASMPENLGAFRDSFRVGWREADTMIAIERQKNTATVSYEYVQASAQ